MRVLVVEDEVPLAEAVAGGGRREGVGGDVAHEGDTRLVNAQVTPNHLHVLDRDLPGRSGDDVCRHLTAEGSLTRVLMLTAAGGLADRVAGLDLGADDYLGKPFAFEELVARVRALGRRATPKAPPVLTGPGGLSLDPAKRIATRAGVPLELTRKEFGVLEELMRAGGAVVSSEDLLERVWDENADPATTIVRVTVMTLRKKLGEPQVVDTVVGVGYRLVEPA
jgi:DNA-binding response OmpR family regulator